ncbi:MAG: N-6 DNA methylase [Sphingobacteriales bacterium]|nr:N-6 DNA methylase [Sphingobacteriales bacterium]
MNLNIFNTANLFEAATHLFQSLGIKLNSNTAEPLPVKDLLKQHYKDNDTFKTIGKTYFIGIIDNTVFQTTGMFDVNYSYKEALQQGDKNYDGLMLFALELSKQPTRTEISDLTRTFNRISQKMPVALVLKYKTGDEACFSIAISERFKYKQNWRQGEKAGKVIILRDIHTVSTHAGHERILLDLVKPVGVTNYDQLHQHWLQVLDVNILNKKFFQDLANWYFWAMENVSFPDDLEKKKDVRNATNLIRLITRVVFIWFIKEKSLVPNALFNKSHLDKILKDFNKNKKSQNYYHVILQNLFFGTLNQKMDVRKFAKDGGNIKTNGEEYGVKNLFRYADLFTISEKEVLALFKDVPFLNGGLFDCLDKPNEENKIVYVDGFSRNPKKQASVPDYIFFGEEREVDLNDIFATKNKKYKSRGLINLLESYKFTVAENTPIEEEIALDPELLGKVFENLLASYNPETQTTARKQTGSFYTPREIVNYMVDESLLEYIKQNVKISDSDFETRLRDLISYAETPNPFDESETKALIEAINNCKILDPACGSGAYPMGILHKMVHLLQKLDPENKYWKGLQRQKAMEETEAAFKIGDKEERGKRLAEINDVFENNSSDYGRKLYLIENCIYGIDIQPIAVQISKLRFFISLIIDQNKQSSKENFGIRSLPNLETKFVAANTLIGLDKPAQTLLRNPDIEVKENQLKELRHKYFTANTRKEKLQYQKQDKKLRQEIAKMLESDGWQTTVAKQIVAFDPYDQNTFAPWFDPEWMFGHSDGFDIVIGNPPYHQLSKDESASDKYKLYLKSRFGTSGGRLNTFIFFTHIGVELLKQKGVITYIIPNTILTQDYYKETRKYLLDKTTLTQIVSYNELPFENAVVENITFFALKSPMPDYTIKHFNDNLSIIEFDTEKTKKEFYKSDTFSFNFRSNAITEKICKATTPLGDLCNINQAIALKGDKSLSLRDNNPKGKFYKLLDGRNINKYQIQWAGVYLDYNLDRIHSGKSKEVFTSKEKLFFRRVSSKLIFAYDNEQYFALNTLVAVNLLPSKNREFGLKYLLGVLNSNLMDYYYVNKHKSTKTVFSEIQARSVGELPIKKAKPVYQKSISTIVDFIIQLKSQDSDSTFFERLIDAMVYELYLPEEIKAGGAEVLKHLGNLPELKEGQDENLPDGKAGNLKTIEKVYKELSDPKHPISAALLKLLTIEEVNIIEGRK